MRGTNLFFCTASVEMLVAAGQGEIVALRKAEVDVSPDPDSLFELVPGLSMFWLPMFWLPMSRQTKHQPTSTYAGEGKGRGEFVMVAQSSVLNGVRYEVVVDVQCGNQLNAHGCHGDGASDVLLRSLGTKTWRASLNPCKAESDRQLEPS